MPAVHPARALAALRAPAAALTALCATSAAAQPAAPPVPAPPAAHAATQTASLNLLGLPVGIAAGEYERAVGRGLALGAGALVDLPRLRNGRGGAGEQLATAQLKLKYYPAERGLRGLALGLTAGVAHARTPGAVTTVVVDGYAPPAVTVQDVSRTAPTLGAVLDYNFLVGRRRPVLVGLGVGARRVLGARRSVGGVDLDPLGTTLPDGRLQVGLGF